MTRNEKQIDELLTLATGMMSSAEREAKKAMADYNHGRGDALTASACVQTMYTVGGIIMALEWVLGRRQIEIPVIVLPTTEYKM